MTHMRGEMQDMLESRRTFLIFIEVVYISTTILGNSMTLYVVIKNPTLRTKRANMFIVSLAVSDLCMGTVVAPFCFILILESSWVLGHHVCQYHGFMVLCLATTSTLTLALTSINRFFNVVKHNVYPRYFTFRRTAVMIACAWFAGILFPCVYIASGEQFVPMLAKLICCMDIIKAPWFNRAGVVLFVLFPFTVMVYCYARVYLVIRKHNSQIFASTRNTRLNVQDVKITRMLFVIVMFYIVSWTPVVIIDLIDGVRGYSSLPFQAYIAYTVFAASSNCVNPIIYGIMNPTFRREYLKVFTKCSEKQTNIILVRPRQTQDDPQ